MISPLTPDPGRSVEIRITQQGNITRYMSRVLDADSQVVLLDQPFRNGRPVALRPGQQITVCLKGEGGVKATGIVVHNRLVPRPGNASYAMGVAFTQISHTHREAMIRFVLYRQSRRDRARWEQN